MLHNDGFIYYDWFRKGKKPIKVLDYYPLPRECDGIAERLAFLSLEKMSFATPTQMLIAMDRQRIYEHLNETHGSRYAQEVLDTTSNKNSIITHFIGNIIFWPFWV